MESTVRPEFATESTPPRSSVVALRELQSTMLSNGDPAMSVVVVEDAAVVVASDDNDGDI
jgi:hypothetical protein